jgi:UDP-N-acetylglucosamine 2-epimerase (non-hydrolysing)
VHTGQHYDYELTKMFFEELQLPDPLLNLNVGSGTHAEQTAKIMMLLERVLMEQKPDLVIVPGDTNSTLAGALTAAKLNIPVAHIEAGPRSYDLRIPEEVNRRLTDHCSSILFAPTRNCVENLRKEGIRSEKIVLSGDTMYDVLLQCLPKAEKSKVLERLGMSDRKYVLLTLHRPDNVDKPENLTSILKALEQIELSVVFPVHPRTDKQLRSTKLSELKHVKATKPVSYHDNLCLIKNAEAVVTDSGGVQKEAFWLHTPCITLRNGNARAEWIETVELGANRYSGTDTKKVLRVVRATLKDETIKERLRKLPNPFGDGHASEKIILAIKRFCVSPA